MFSRSVFLIWVVSLIFPSGGVEGCEKRSEMAESHADSYGDPLPPEAVARLGTIRLHQDDRIGALAFSPDGKILASGGSFLHHSGSQIYLWNAITGKQLRVFGDEATEGVSLLDFSPDGKTLVSLGNYEVLFRNGSHRGNEEIPFAKINLWDVATGKRRFTLTGHRSHVTSAAFSPDGKLLASVSADDTIRLWDLSAGKTIRAIKQKGSGFSKVYFTPDGKSLVTSGTDDGIRLWDVVTGKQIRILKTRDYWNTIRLSPDGKIVACSGARRFDDKIRLWDLASGKQLGEFPEPGISGFWCFGPDSESLIIGIYDRRRYDAPLELWNWKKGKKVREFEGRLIDVTATAVSPGGRTLAVADGASIRLWNVHTGKEASFLASHRELIHSVAVSPDRGIAVTGSDDGTIRLWELLSGKPLQVWDGRQGQVAAVAFSADGKLVASGGSEIVRIWDVQSAKNLASFTGSGGDWFLQLAFSPDGKTLVGGSWGGKVYRWDVKSGKEHRRLDLHGNAAVTPMALSLGVRNLSCISEDGANIYDLDSGALVPRFEDNEVLFLEGSLKASAFSPDGSLLAAANRNGEIYLRETIHNKVIDSILSRIQGPDAPLLRADAKVPMSSIFSLAFAPDGRFVAAGYGNGKIILWDLLHGKHLHIFHGPASRVSTITLTPDGNYLISGSQDGTALVWKMPDGIRRLHRQGKILTDTELSALEADLAGRDARKAYLAVESLTAAPEQSVSLLRRKLRPIEVMDATRVPRLITDLDSDRFAVRQAATRELSKLGDRAEVQLRATLAGQPTLETRRRIEDLLRDVKLQQLYVPRAILVLERIATPDARQILQDLTKGDAAAWQTRTARAALERVSRR